MVTGKDQQVQASKPGFDPAMAVQYLKGVGPKKAAVLAENGVHTILDLLYRLPRKYLDRSHIAPINQLTPELPATVVGRVVSTGILKGRKSRFEAVISDGTGYISLLWFSGINWVKKALQKGVTISASGRVSYYHGLQLVHPEYEILEDEDDEDLLHTGRVIPLYPSNEELKRIYLDSRGMRRLIKPLTDVLAHVDIDFFTREFREKHNLPSLEWSLRCAHFPETVEDAERARLRLAFDELFFLQLSLAYTKRVVKNRVKNRACNPPGALIKSFGKALPFQLTAAQKRVLREIADDMCAAQPMYRLLQGDVGSGKTIVALFAMLVAIESGRQAALMVPTEILAEQHGRTTRKLLAGLPVNIAVITGSLSPKEKDEVWDQIETGSVQLVIGTHALFSRGRRFADLGLAVVDEQHRFGVSQRAQLLQKGEQPDVLVMTATPIPRTLALTLYGDLDISIIDEMPPQKGTIQTVRRTEDARDKMYEFIRETTAAGRQVYVVYPLVDESEKLDLKAASAGYEELAAQFAGRRVGLVHGRLPAGEREEVMTRFFDRDIDILVSTTVIEVGVDAPDAGVMVIENAERFGLSQLHQLRGRIGRGPGRAVCILMVGGALSDIARARIEALCQYTDGFRIAEMDLELRGPGEFFGTRQHGLPELRIAHPVRDATMIPAARTAAFELAQQDAGLKKPEHHALREEFKRRYGKRFNWFQIG